VNDSPDTSIWRELRRRAADTGVLDIAVRTAATPVVVDVTWPGGETESLRFHTGDDPDALAHALARELRLVLEPPTAG
jgi:hypothetical protein